MNPEANESKRHDRDPVALGALREAVELVGLDSNQVLHDGARLELRSENPRRAVLVVSVLLTADQTAMVLGRLTT